MVIGKLWLSWDWRCMHWPSFERGLRDDNEVVREDEWEFLLGPLHVLWIDWSKP
jgi:hypothetical protein